MTELKIMKAPSEVLEVDDVGVWLEAEMAKGRRFYQSVKCDGYHCVIKKGKIYSGSMKDDVLINPALRERLRLLLSATERLSAVICGELYARGQPFESLGALRSQTAPLPPGLKLYVFDGMSLANWENPTQSFDERKRVVEYFTASYPNVTRIHQMPIQPGEAFVAEERVKKWIAQGYEGCMLAERSGLYKHGRVSRKDARIIKVKGFDHHDGEVIAVEEGLKIPEGVERRRGPTGRLEPLAKGSKVPSGTFGRFRVRITSGPFEGREMTIGRWKGFTDALGQEIWQNRDDYVGRHCRFRGMKGAKDLPRIPKDFAWRDEK